MRAFLEWLRNSVGSRITMHFHGPVVLNFVQPRAGERDERHVPRLLANVQPQPERRRLEIALLPSRRERLLEARTDPRIRENWARVMRGVSGPGK
jgi:hypothetical protein